MRYWSAIEASQPTCLCVCQKDRGRPTVEVHSIIASPFIRILLSVLTSWLNAELSLVALFAGHCKPSAICVLNPLCSLAVEQALVNWLQLVNSQSVGCGAGLVQPQVSRCHPLAVCPPRAKDKVSGEGDQLLWRGGRLFGGAQVPTHRQVRVLDCCPRHLAGELQRVAFDLGEGLGWSHHRQWVSNDCGGKWGRDVSSQNQDVWVLVCSMPC